MCLTPVSVTVLNVYHISYIGSCRCSELLHLYARTNSLWQIAEITTKAIGGFKGMFRQVSALLIGFAIATRAVQAAQTDITIGM